MRASIVVEPEAGTSCDVARQIAGLPGVKMADACWDSRDVFAVVEVRGSRLSGFLQNRDPTLTGIEPTTLNGSLATEGSARFSLLHGRAGRNSSRCSHK